MSQFLIKFCLGDSCLMPRKSQVNLDVFDILMMKIRSTKFFIYFIKLFYRYGIGEPYFNYCFRNRCAFISGRGHD